MFKPFLKRQILDASKLTGFIDDNFKIDEDGRKFSKWVENTRGKRSNCSLRAISPFPTVFSKDLYSRHVKNQGLFLEGLKGMGFNQVPSLYGHPVDHSNILHL